MYKEHLGRDFVSCNVWAVSEHDAAFEYVFEFADVAGPWVAHHEEHDVVVYADDVFSGFGAETAEEVIDKGGDIVWSFAERFEAEAEYVESVVEVFSEAVPCNGFAKVVVGSGDDADVDFDGIGTADAFEFAFL